MPTVLSTSMKRTSSSSSAFKRPAAKAKTGALNQTVESLKRGWGGDDEDTNTKKNKKKETARDDPEESADADGDADASYGEPRDKGKAVKFAQMRKSLPAHILQLYDEEAAKKASPRAFRSQIVNTLFRKNFPMGGTSCAVMPASLQKPSASLKPRRRRTIRA